MDTHKEPQPRTMQRHAHTRERDTVACTGSDLLTRLTLRGRPFLRSLLLLRPSGILGRVGPQPPVQCTPHSLPSPLKARLLLMALEGRVGSGSTPPSPLSGPDSGVKGRGGGGGRASTAITLPCVPLACEGPAAASLCNHLTGSQLWSPCPPSPSTGYVPHNCCC